MDNKEIRERIENLADDKYKEFHTGLCPNTIEIIGVRVPKLREFAKYIAKNENVAVDTIMYLCDKLECQPCDILEYKRSTQE